MEVTLKLLGRPQRYQAPRMVNGRVYARHSKSISLRRPRLMAAARRALEAQCPKLGLKQSVRVEVQFFFKRYHKYYNKDGSVVKDCPIYFTGKPDIDTQDCCTKAVIGEVMVP